MIRHTPLIQLMLVIIFVSGCATGPNYLRVDDMPSSGPTSDPTEAFTVVLPGGWVRAMFYRADITITYDGVLLHYIELAAKDHRKAFSSIDEKTSEGLLVTELAELMIANLKSNEYYSGVEVLENSPTTLDGKQAVRIHVRYDQEGVRYEGINYGMVDENGYYQLSYWAPSLHYFQRDVDTFEELVKSFRLT
jgi:hypothetical protein